MATAIVVRGAQSELEGTYAAYAWLVNKYGKKDEGWKLYRIPTACVRHAAVLRDAEDDQLPGAASAPVWSRWEPCCCY